MGTKYTSSSSYKVVDAAASAAAAFACFVTWDRAPRLGVPRPVALGTGAVVAGAAGVLSPDAGGDCTSDSTAAGLLPTGGGGRTSDTAAGAVDDPASVAKAAAVPAGPDDVAGGDEDKSIPGAAISLRACILLKAIASGVSRISAVLKNATVVRSVVARASASRASELSLSVRDARMSSLSSRLAALEPRGRDWNAPAAGGPFSFSSESLGEAGPPADAMEEPAPPAPPSAAAAPAAPLNLSTWRNTRQHGTHGQVVCLAFSFVVFPFALSDARSFRIAS